VRCCWKLLHLQARVKANMGLLFTKIWSCFGNEGKIEVSLTPVKFSVTNRVIFKFYFMKLSASECILKSVMHSLAETVRHLIILTSCHVF
jgi:hypothetical protein